MTLSVDFKIEKGYLHATMKGSFTLQGALDIFMQILEKCKETNNCKIMVDYREVTGKLSTMDRFRYSKKAAEIFLEGSLSGKYRNLKMVYIASEELYDPQDFGVTVAHNRGLRSVFVTPDYNDGLEWLLAEEGK